MFRKCPPRGVPLFPIVFGYIMNSIGSMFSDFHKFDKQLKQNMAVINKYMRKKNISKNLQQEIQEYLGYVWRESEQASGTEDIIIEQLSDLLKEKLQLEANKMVLIDSPYMSKFSEKVIRKTVPLIKEYKQTPEETIFLQDQLDDCSIYFVEKGQVELYHLKNNIYQEIPPRAQTLQIYTKGQCFGAHEFFTGKPRSFNCRSTEFSIILGIKRDDFLQLIRDFPEDNERFCHIRDSLLHYDQQQIIGESCMTCQSKSHAMSRCPLTHYVPQRHFVIARHLFQAPVKREAFERSQIKMNSL